MIDVEEKKKTALADSRTRRVRVPLPVWKGDPLRRIFLLLGSWLALITAAHLWMNVNWAVMLNDRLPEAQRKLNVAYIPVT